MEIAEFSVWLGRQTTHRRRLLKLVAKASQTIGEVFYRGAKRLFYLFCYPDFDFFKLFARDFRLPV